MDMQGRVIVKDACAWPNLFHIDSNRVGAVIFNKSSHGLEEGSLDLWCYDRGLDQWQYLSTPCPNLPGQNRMHSCCGVNNDGTIHVLSTGFTIAEGKLVQLESLWHSISVDHGNSWQIIRDLTIEGMQSTSIPHGSILSDDAGSLYATLYLSFGKNNPSNSWIIKSDDNGSSWRIQSQIGDGDTNEVHMARRGNLLFAAVRTHRDHHTRLFQSHDWGANWHDYGPLTLPMQHPGHLLGFHKDGLLLTYGIRNRGLMAIGGRISLDCGKTWLAPFILYQFPDSTTDCGYPSSVKLDEDGILTGYYTDVSRDYEGYQFGTLQWKLSDFLTPKQLRSISNGRQMQV